MTPDPEKLSLPELRVAVAEECGWKQTNEPITGCWIDPADGKILIDCPHYPEDANAALTLCERMAEKGWEWQVRNVKEGISCSFWKGHNFEQMGKCVADTLPLAICRAFLQAHAQQPLV